jgi:hypothetical protein
MAAPVPEIVDASLYVRRAGCNSRFMLENTGNFRISKIYGTTCIPTKMWLSITTSLLVVKKEWSRGGFTVKLIVL